MTIHLGVLYHWAPKRHRESILRDGLRVMEASRKPNGEGQPFPWICLATSPSSAWGLIIDPASDDDGAWDLWQVRVGEGDHLEIRGDFAPYVREIRVMHGLPADRVWWVAERNAYAHETIRRRAKRR